MITADTLTIEQIQSITKHPLYLAARAADRPPWRTQLHLVHVALDPEDSECRREARARCAEILNQRADKDAK